MVREKSALIDARINNSETRGPAGIHSATVFQALLRHERSRSDRDGSKFSLAVFDISGMSSNGKGIRRAGRHIQEKMRSIDELGWLDEQRLGVLLPVTGVEGGKKFATRVGESMPCTVFTYPTHWLSGSNGDSGNGSGHTNKLLFEDVLGRVFCHRVPAWKRCMDILGSLVAIVLSSPVFIIVSLYIKTVSRGRVLFMQKRVGYKGKQFTFLKFRTMHEKNDASDHRDYLKELIRTGKPMEKLDACRDKRIIPGGKILRKCCIDELTQLFNVLRGDMSLVGPRPCIPYEAEEYLRWHAHRFDVLPGMTGLWQVSGKNKLSFEQMIRLDISYMKRMSPLFDLKILLLTTPAIIRMVLEASFKKLSGKENRKEQKSAAEGSLENA
jgi:lipopolysaccharide/colanic/teichoic acid biosynthesis glycosyltransferase